MTLVRTSRTSGVFLHPLPDMFETPTVPTALAPHVQSPHHGVTDGAPGGGGLTLLTPPGPAPLVQLLIAPRTPGVHRGGLLVLGVH